MFPDLFKTLCVDNTIKLPNIMNKTDMLQFYLTLRCTMPVLCKLCMFLL